MSQPIYGAPIAILGRFMSQLFLVYVLSAFYISTVILLSDSQYYCICIALVIAFVHHSGHYDGSVV